MAQIPPKQTDETLRPQLAAAVGEDNADEAMKAYEDAAIAGLCHEGAWEAALGAVNGHQPPGSATPLSNGPTITRSHP